MLRPLLLSLALSTTVAGCATISQSAFNPLNWFGNSEEVLEVETDRSNIRPLVAPGDLVTVVETRPLVSTVTALRVDQTPGGAIVTAQGVVPTQGFFNAELVARGRSNGILTYEFRAEAPAGFEGTGTVATRTITAADALSDAELAGVRTIRVVGQTNARESRR